MVGFFPAYHHFAIPWHDHDFYELGIVESGSGLHVSPSGSEPFRRGTVVLVPPGAGHEYRSCVEMRVLNCFFRAELDELELAWAFRDPGLRRLFNPTGVAAAQGRAPGRRAPARRARAAPHARGPGGHPRPAAGTSDPARGAGAPAGRARLPRGRRRDRARAPGTSDRRPRSSSRRRASSWSATSTHPVDAGRAERTPVRRAVPSRPPVRSIRRHAPDALPRRWRAQRAAGLLVSTDQSVAAIGAAVGWPDPSQFSRRFRAEFGVSPRAYRQHVAVVRRCGGERA